jgi:plasmid maintenance system antidote protein VapI
MVALSEQAGGIASAAARILLERKNRTEWTNHQLADSLGWSRNTVDRYLHGERAMPLDAFYRLGRLLDLDPVRGPS